MGREEIERPDFSSARRGYDRAAVDAHLRRVADQVEALGSAAAARVRPTRAADATSGHVRAILAAAEHGARDPGPAGDQVEDAAHGMLQKLDRLQAELDRLLGGLKASAETLTGPRGDVGTLGGAPGPEPPAASAGR